MQTQQEPLILTVRLDDESQAFFDKQRELYFPPDRNFLKAHLTVFHQLPNNIVTEQYFQGFKLKPFPINVTGLFGLGSGVAYSLQSDLLIAVRKTVANDFAEVLIPQDRQGFRPHITVQNKVSPLKAKELLHLLSETFTPFITQAIGLDLWTYLGGPWEHKEFYAFT